jgi:hypothetical protein
MLSEKTINQLLLGIGTAYTTKNGCQIVTFLRNYGLNYFSGPKMLKLEHEN